MLQQRFDWLQTKELVKRYRTLLMLVAGIAFLHALLSLKLLLTAHPRRYSLAVSLFSPQLCLFAFAFLGRRLFVESPNGKVGFVLPAWGWYVLTLAASVSAAAVIDIAVRLTGGLPMTVLWNDARGTLSAVMIYPILWFVPAIAFELSWRRMGHLLIGPPGEYVNRIAVGVASATAQAPLMILRTGVLDGVLWLAVVFVKHIVIADICGRLYQQSRSVIIPAVFLAESLGLRSLTLGLGGNLADDLKAATVLWIVAISIIAVAERTHWGINSTTPSAPEFTSR